MPCLCAGPADVFLSSKGLMGEREEEHCFGFVVILVSWGLDSFVDLLDDCYRYIQDSQRVFPEEAIQLVARTLEFARSRIHGAKQGGMADAFSLSSIQRQMAVLMGLEQVVESAHPLALFGIATFAIFEVCSGPFGRWHCHLHGARSLLDLHCHNRVCLESLGRKISGLVDVLGYMLWFDVTGALVQGSPLIFDDWHRETLQTSFLDSVGCPLETFELFVHLAQSKCRNVDVVDLSWRAMEQTLQVQSSDWKSDQGLAAVVYRYTAVILTFSRMQTVSGTVRSSQVLSSIVDRVCDAVVQMNPQSKFYVHLASPVYLTGMHARTKAQCAVVRSYWRNCRLGDFPRYPDGQEQCERIWRDNRVIR
ncbi:hypothetical protein EYZ11_008645 [Aspergillus tanneri]|uniref:Transcription factor domain-containing protein n=1 Tax=Aspergillus tanneri TaxID=1220188 RepID=A0A4S3J9Y0_9EURO|nr:hypothetical protein EYZ11_008645 [Aspergillus tanneri]